MFAILVLMALFTTFITTPIVMAIYKPARGKSTPTYRKLGDLKSNDDDLRVLACIHGPSNVASIINFIESTRSTKNSSLQLFIMHLVELTERSSSIILAQRARKNGFPFFNSFHRHEWQDRLAGAFRAYSQLGLVSVWPTTAISSLSTMHEDICHVAEDQRVTLIILPFHKQWRRVEMEEEEEEKNGVHQHQIVESVGHGWRGVNLSVLRNAPCSVALLIDRGHGNGPLTLGPTATVAQSICVVFFGGPDDREALELGDRMSEHPAVKVTIVRFGETNELEGKMNREKEKELDEKAMANFRSKWDGTVKFIEKVTSNIVEEVLAMGRSGDYDLIVVGKGRFPSIMVTELTERQAEQAELGPIGDILASSGLGVVSSVLVIQQYDVAQYEGAPLSMIQDDVV